MFDGRRAVSGPSRRSRPQGSRLKGAFWGKRVGNFVRKHIRKAVDPQSRCGEERPFSNRPPRLLQGRRRPFARVKACSRWHVSKNAPLGTFQRLNVPKAESRAAKTVAPQERRSQRASPIPIQVVPPTMPRHPPCRGTKEAPVHAPYLATSPCRGTPVATSPHGTLVPAPLVPWHRFRLCSKRGSRPNGGFDSSPRFGRVNQATVSGPGPFWGPVSASPH